MAPCNWNINIGCCPDWDSHDEDVQQAATAYAVTVMWAATGRRYGLCEVTVQPCNPTPAEPLYLTYPIAAAPGYRTSSGFSVGSPFADGGGCGTRCTCRARCETRLDGPVDSITEVQIGGVAVDPAAYRVLDHNTLVRIDGECWPTCADYGNQDPPGFEVTYLRGEPVPEAAETAAGTLACEFAKACTGGDCRLPKRLASLSRQGVELQVADVGTYLDHMLTGIDEVDRVIVALNPHRQHARPQVLSVDLPSPRQLT